ncbi:MAG: cytochrome oxidase putative small subunit CydP, partial [Candidatus Eiseniibacteriota bacterium]
PGRRTDGPERPGMTDRRLGVELALFFAAKVVALCVIWALWFSPADRPTVDAGTIATTLFDQPTTDGTPR